MRRLAARAGTGGRGAVPWRAAAAFPALLLAAAPALGAEPSAAPLTAGDALRAVAARSQAAVSAGLLADAAKEQTRKAEAAFYPQLTVSGGWFGRDHEVIAVFGTLEAPTTQKNFVVAEIAARQLIWDGGRRSAALSTSRSGEEAVAALGRADVLSAQLEALSSYLQAQVLAGQKKVVEQRISSLEAHLKEARDLLDQGLVARNDVLGTEVRLRTVRDRLAPLDDGVAVAARALARLMGTDPSGPLRLTDLPPAPPALPAPAAELCRRAASASPRLAALKGRLAVEEGVAGLRKRDVYPSLFAEASHSYQQNEYLAYPHANVLFVGLSWLAWDGGAREAARRQADLLAERTRREIEDATRALDVELERARRELEQALREAATAEQNSGAAAENLRIVEDQYRAGVGRTSEVLDAEALLAESRFSAVEQRARATLKEAVLVGQAGLDLAAFLDGTGGSQER